MPGVILYGVLRIKSVHMGEDECKVGLIYHRCVAIGGGRVLAAVARLKRVLKSA